MSCACVSSAHTEQVIIRQVVTGVADGSGDATKGRHVLDAAALYVQLYPADESSTPVCWSSNETSCVTNSIV